MNQLSRLRRSKGHAALSTEDIVARVVQLNGPDVLQFTLDHQPVPLSACFVNVARNGRADSPRYKMFKADVDEHLAKMKLRGALMRPMFSTNVAVDFTVRKPDGRRRDIDNLTKCLCDTLTRNFILKDDSQIVDLRIRWMTLMDAFYGSVHVEIRKV